MTDQRKAFEAWWTDRFPERPIMKSSRDDGSYFFSDQQLAWLGWQAALSSLPVEAIRAGIAGIEFMDAEDYEHCTTAGLNLCSEREVRRKAHISALQSLLPESK